MVSEAAYDLILMDMQMPKMGGLEATLQIRLLEQEQTQKLKQKQTQMRTIPIVATTANVFQEDRVRCLTAGMNDFIIKPISPVTLYATVLRWLSGSPSEAGRVLPNSRSSQVIEAESP